MTFEQFKYQNEYNKEKYDRCIFNVPKGYKKIIEQHYKERGYKSLNAYVTELIYNDINKRNNQNIKITQNGDNNTVNIN